MTEEKYYWESIEQLLDEAKKVHILEIEYNDKNFKLAWKEIMESTDLDMDIPDKSYSEMNIKEKQDFNMKILEAEALARIKEAGEVEGCFNKNKIDKMMWSKFPSRLKALVINELFQVNKALEKRF
jgi:hypothetical protein